MDIDDEATKKRYLEWLDKELGNIVSSPKLNGFWFKTSGCNYVDRNVMS